MANTFTVSVYIEHGFEDGDAFCSWLELLIRGEMARAGWIGDSNVSKYVDADDMTAALTQDSTQEPAQAAQEPAQAAPMPEPVQPAPQAVTEPYAPAPVSDTPPGTADLPPAA